jgi:hypothetical protein
VDLTKAQEQVINDLIKKLQKLSQQRKIDKYIFREPWELINDLLLQEIMKLEKENIKDEYSFMDKNS